MYRIIFSSNKNTLTFFFSNFNHLDLLLLFYCYDLNFKHCIELVRKE